MSFNILVGLRTTRVTPRPARTYTPRPFENACMEPNKIKEELTALQVRFDALRGYL